MKIKTFNKYLYRRLEKKQKFREMFRYFKVKYFTVHLCLYYMQLCHGVKPRADCRTPKVIRLVIKGVSWSRWPPVMDIGQQSAPATAKVLMRRRQMLSLMMKMIMMTIIARRQSRVTTIPTTSSKSDFASPVRPVTTTKTRSSPYHSFIIFISVAFVKRSTVCVSRVTMTRECCNYVVSYKFLCIRRTCDTI